MKCFCGCAYSSDLIGHILIEQVNRKEKSHADWTNRHILEKGIVEKKDKTSNFQSTNKLNKKSIAGLIPHLKYFQNELL